MLTVLRIVGRGSRLEGATTIITITTTTCLPPHGAKNNEVPIVVALCSQIKKRRPTNVKCCLIFCRRKCALVEDRCKHVEPGKWWWKLIVEHVAEPSHKLLRQRPRISLSRTSACVPSAEISFDSFKWQSWSSRFAKATTATRSAFGESYYFGSFSSSARGVGFEKSRYPP